VVEPLIFRGTRWWTGRAIAAGVALTLAAAAWALLRPVASERRPRQDGGHWAAVARGREYLGRNRPDLALRAVEGVRDEGPGSGAAMTVAGLALVRMGEVQAARLTFERAARLDPTQLEAVRALAELELGLGNGVRGAALLQESVRLAPADPRLWRALGRVRHDLGESKQAAAAFEQALNLDAGDRATRLALIADLLNSSQVDRATPWVALALKDEPDDSNVLALAARHARDSGDLAEASRRAQRAIAIDPDNLEARLVRSKLNLAGGDAARALEDLVAATAAHPGHPLAWLMRSQAESRLGRPEDAARSVERYRAAELRVKRMDQLTRDIAARPDDPALRLALGQAAAEGGATLLAERCYRAALALRPGYQPALEALKALDRGP
jgi:predicted Zn-dependent protease